MIIAAVSLIAAHIFSSLVIHINFHVFLFSCWHFFVNNNTTIFPRIQNADIIIGIELLVRSLVARVRNDRDEWIKNKSNTIKLINMTCVDFFFLFFLLLLFVFYFTISFQILFFFCILFYYHQHATDVILRFIKWRHFSSSFSRAIAIFINQNITISIRVARHFLFTRCDYQEILLLIILEYLR